MADDACSAVKSDLSAGVHTNYTGNYKVYIENEDEFEGGNVFIILRDATREPVQTVDGTVLYTKRSCTLNIQANSTTNRDNLYDDIVNILIATTRGYVLKKGKDTPANKEKFVLNVSVSMLL